MKIFTILSILAIAAPSSLAADSSTAPKRKRVFKIYTPEEIRRLESYDDRMLKKTKEPIPSPMSMSMPTDSPSMSPESPAPSMSPESPAPSVTADVVETTAPVTPTSPAPTPSPIRELPTGTSAPTMVSSESIGGTTMSPTLPPVVPTNPPVSAPDTPGPTLPPISDNPTASPVASTDRDPGGSPGAVEEGVFPPDSGAMYLGTKLLAAAAVAIVMVFV